MDSVGATYGNRGPWSKHMTTELAENPRDCTLSGLIESKFQALNQIRITREKQQTKGFGPAREVEANTDNELPHRNRIQLTTTSPRFPDCPKSMRLGFGCKAWTDQYSKINAMGQTIIIHNYFGNNFGGK